MPVTFTKVKLPFGWLGNMAPYPVTHNGKVWRTTEALFQALRFDQRYEGITEAIRLEKSPMGAKMRAKGHAHEMVVEPMSAADVANMELCIRLKLEQHPELVEQLLATDDETIIEDVGGRAAGRHLFWGMALKDGEWTGQNTLGNIWMKLREELRHGGTTLQPHAPREGDRSGQAND